MYLCGLIKTQIATTRELVTRRPTPNSTLMLIYLPELDLSNNVDSVHNHSEIGTLVTIYCGTYLRVSF